MDSKEYKEIVDKTSVFPTKVDDFSLAYATLGLFDELGEVIDKSTEVDDPMDEGLLRESGDVLWYVAALCKYAGITFERVVKQGLGTTNTEKVPLAICGMVKKLYRDDKELDKKELKKRLSTIIYAMTDGDEDRLSKIMQMNYDKLTKRKEKGVLKGDGDNREEE